MFHAGWADSSNSTGDNPNGTTNLDLCVARVSLTAPDALVLSPASGILSSGLTGGPFTPASQAYTLTNNGPAPLTWSASNAQPWVTLSSTGATLAAGASTTVTVSLNAAAATLGVGAYSDTVTLTNVTSGFAQTRGVSLNVNPPRPDYFTELFDTGGTNDTDNQSWLFTPDASPGFYSVLRTAAVAAFPTDPTGGATLTLSDDSFAQVTPAGGVLVKLYGVSYTSFFVGSNGYVTFGSGASTLTESLANHFLLPRIAALFDDLNPGSAGTVSWKQLADRVAVTFQNVPQYNASDSNNFQIEMFFDGRIRITCLAIAATDGLIGLSRGQGTPADFAESDFSAYGLPAPAMMAEPAVTGGTSNTVAWGTVTGATNYDVQRATASDFSDAVTVGLLTATSNVFAGLSDGVLYRYRARARRNASLSAWSAAVASTQDASAPAVIVTSAATAYGPAYRVSGMASDVSGVSALTVNGVAASSGDGFAQWSAPATLAPGSNSFTIVALDGVAPANTRMLSFNVNRDSADANANGLPDAWEALYGGPGADPNRNGRINLLEFALGLDPVGADIGALPPPVLVPDLGDGRVHLTWSFRRRTDWSGLSYIPEVSTVLATWENGAARVQTVGTPTPNPDGVTETVTVRALPSADIAGAPRFIRLRVTAP